MLLAELISTPEYLIQRPDWADYCRRIQTITFCDQQIDTAQLPQLMEAIRQDCLEGNMIQCYAYHAKDGELGWMEITLQLTGLKKDEERGRCLTIYDSSTQTVTWLKENGYLDWDVNDPETEKFPEKAG